MHAVRTYEAHARRKSSDRRENRERRERRDRWERRERINRKHKRKHRRKIAFLAHSCNNKACTRYLLKASHSCIFIRQGIHGYS